MALKYYQIMKPRNWLLTLLVLQILLQCASSGSVRQNNKKSAANNHNESTDTKEQTALTMGEASDKPDDHLHEAEKAQMDEKQPNSTEMPHQGEDSTPKIPMTPAKTSAPANAGNNPISTVPPKQGVKGNKPGKNNVKMIKCNTTSDCSQYMGSECSKPSKENITRCLCGNFKSPETNTSCKDMKHYVNFPCKFDSHCVTNAECKPRNNTNAQPGGGHARACVCKSGFEHTEDGSECLDALEYFKLQHSKTIHSMLNQLKNLKVNQEEVKQRLQTLENSAEVAFPSITVLLICGTLLAR